MIILSPFAFSRNEDRFHKIQIFFHSDLYVFFGPFGEIYTFPEPCHQCTGCGFIKNTLFQGFTMQETADALGQSAATVHRRLQKAEALLKDALEGGEAHE